jgi:hypothetical protein
VHELPPENIQNRFDMDKLEGFWERPVVSPYSIADSKSHIAGKEFIEISGDDYTKTHLYAEVVHGEKKNEIYRERGNIQLDGPWLLMTPTSAEYHKKEEKIPDSVNELPELPKPEKIKLEQGKRPEALLYFMDREQLIMTPLVMERMGKIYEWGVYEGSIFPHDSESSSFLKAVYIYNNKRYQKHGYIKRR